MNGSSSGVLVVGCGTVGSATVQLLLNRSTQITARSGVHLNLIGIVSRTFSRAKALGFPESLFSPDLDVALSDERVSIVVETVGGLTDAATVVRKAIAAGKHVVTANKALIAEHGDELFTAARESGVCIALEAACAGGIPVLRALYDGLIANEIEAMFGIVNGTSNYILSRMVDSGVSYEEALAEAKQEGYAEADPTLDVNGTDSAHKLAIMAGMAFGLPCRPGDIKTDGIDTLDTEDVRYAGRLGYVVKLLAIAKRHDNGVSLIVRPAFISRHHPLAWVSGPFNAISIYGNVTGHTMYYGRGAGGEPTASSILADIVSLARGSYQPVFAESARWAQGDRTPLVAADVLSHRYYLRLMVDDTPGTLARIATILSEHEISIASVLQSESDDEEPTEPVPVVITLHRTREALLKEPLERIAALDAVKCVPRPITIVDEHPE